MSELSENSWENFQNILLIADFVKSKKSENMRNSANKNFLTSLKILTIPEYSEYSCGSRNYE